MGSEPGMGELSSNEIRCPGNVHGHHVDRLDILGTPG